MTRHVAWLALTALGTLFACGNDAALFGTNDDDSGGSGGSASSSTGSSTGGSTSTTTTAIGGGPATGGMGGVGGAGGCANPGPDDDNDMDGFTPAMGDCDDCEATVNPNAIEISGNSADEDCDGNLDNTSMPCDMGLAINEDNAVTALGAIELCKQSSGPGDWGVVSAQWVLADGSAPTSNNFAVGHGVLPDFGPNVATLAGDRMLVLSNGTARRPGDPGYQGVDGNGKGYQSPLPPSFPKDSASCTAMTSGPAHDPMGIETTVRVPSNATGFSFHFDFYAADYPSYICSQYDDQFVALVSPVPMGLMDENVTFNAAGDIFSVNGAVFDVCGCMTPPCMAGGKSFACSQGTMRLMGNGYGSDVANNDRGATGWQLTTVPVMASSEVTIRFAIWDMGDDVFSATALLDDFQWLTDAGVVVETVPDP